MTQLDLQNQVAIVTGAARGIGFAITQRLLDSGAAVSLWDVDASALEAAKSELGSPDRVHSAVVDVTSESSVHAAAESTKQRFGKISVAVNNAGIAGNNAKTWELSVD